MVTMMWFYSFYLFIRLRDCVLAELDRRVTCLQWALDTGKAGE